MTERLGELDLRTPAPARRRDEHAPDGRLTFDDQPLASLLAMGGEASPTAADPFADAEATQAAVRQAVEDDQNLGLALRIAASALAGGMAIPARFLDELVQLLRGVIPAVPLPIVADHGVAYDLILAPCYQIATAGGHAALRDLSGTLLYRWYEGVGRFADARAVVTRLLLIARQQRRWIDVAILTNNLGYEYLLAGDHGRAEPVFRRAAELFSAHGSAVEVANAEANRLLCDYGIDPLAPADWFERRARHLLDQLATDWRRRKLLRLIATIDEQRGDLEAAIANLEQCVQACRDIATRHRLDDQAYLASLRERVRVGV